MNRTVLFSECSSAVRKIDCSRHIWALDESSLDWIPGGSNEEIMVVGIGTGCATFDADGQERIFSLEGIPYL